MLIKFTKHGKGCGRKAAAYLLDEKDHQNNIRASVEVLAGDPLIFSAICESSKHTWKYSSAVIAFAPEDNPTPKQLRQVINTFEKYAFAGLNPQRYHLFAVLHTDDDGSKHIHVLTPRLDLDTGRSINIAPPGHHKYFDPLRDYFNYKNGWARPDDPARMKDTQEPNYVYLQRAAAIAAGLKKESLKTIQQQLDEFLKVHIEAGLIQEHQDIVKALKSIEAIKEVRVSKNAKTAYIAIKIEGRERPIRLKGAFYESEFCIETYRTVGAAKDRINKISAGVGELAEEHQALTEQSRQRARELYQKRKQYYREVYEQSGGTGSQDKRTGRNIIAEPARNMANADELAGNRQQQGRDRENQTTVTELSVRDRTADRTNATNHPTAAGSTPKPDQQSVSEPKERPEDSVYGYRHSGVISHPALLHLLCRQDASHQNSVFRSTQHHYWRATVRTREIPYSPSPSPKPAFSQHPEVDHHEQRAKSLIVESDRAIERAYATVEQTERAIAAAKYGTDQAKQRIEKFKRRCRQILQTLGSEKQSTNRGELSSHRENPADAGLPAAATILQELTARFTAAIAEAYSAITRKTGLKSHAQATSAESDTAINQPRDTRPDTAASLQITAGIPSLTHSDRTALADIKAAKESHLTNMSTSQNPAGHSLDLDM